MAFKLEIIDNAVQVTDTGTSEVLIAQPAKDTWYIEESLDKGLVELYGTTGTNEDNIKRYRQNDNSFNGFDLVQCVDAGDVTFTEETFRSFCYSNLGKSSSQEGGQTLDNRIIINQSNAQSVLSGFIDSTKTYFVDGVVILDGLGVNFRLLGGLNLRGYGGGSSFIVCSDDNYTLFEGAVTGNGFFKQGVSFVVSGTNSKVHNLAAQTGRESYNLSEVGYFDCTSLGELNGFLQGLENNVFKLGGTPELTLSGSWVGYRIITAQARDMENASFSLFNEGTSLSFSSRFEADMNIDLSASSSFTSFQSSNFTQPSLFQLNGCIITRDGVANAEDTNINPNITNIDIASSWSGNQGMKNTFVGGRLTITNEVTTSIGNGTDFYDLAGVYAPSKLVHFDEPNNGHLRHLGNNPREYRVVFNGLLESRRNDVLTLKIVKWDDSAGVFVDIATDTKQVNSLVGNRDIAAFNWEDEVELDKYDYVKYMVRNADVFDVTAELDTRIILEAR